MDNLPQNNKKTFLYSLTAKIILALIIFAGSAIIIISGTKFIVEYYKTQNNQIQDNQINKTQCEIDSDCKFVYTGSDVCPPCNTLIEEYKCLPLKEAQKIEKERFDRMVDNNILCERCLEKPQHSCICENGKCEKVKIIEKKNCAKEGEIPGKQGCCQGLVTKGSARVGKNGECLYMHHLECLKCGDGLCDEKYENKCNCQEDCGDNTLLNCCDLECEQYRYSSCPNGCTKRCVGSCPVCANCDGEGSCYCSDNCGDEKKSIPPVVPIHGVMPPPRDDWPVYEQKFYCEKDSDCLATCTSPGCYNKNWYETVMRGDCEAVITHSCRCIENECIRHPLLKEDIESEIRKSNYCDTEDDCARADSSCLLGCNVVVNKNKVARINKLIGIIKGKCLVDCGEIEEDLDCVDNKCIIFR